MSTKKTNQTEFDEAIINLGISLINDVKNGRVDKFRGIDTIIRLYAVVRSREPPPEKIK